ncbi:hypothetical protein ACWEQG_01750 [Microbispora sp. NPDC004025]
MAQELLVAMIGVGGTVAGSAVTFIGTGVLQWRQGRGADQKARQQAVSELLTAAVMLHSSVQAFRVAWINHRSLFSPARAVMTDYNLALLPRLERVTRALSDVTQWRSRRSQRMVDAARRLTDAAGQLVENAGTTSDSTYKKACTAFNDALREFRSAVDKRGA